MLYTEMNRKSIEQHNAEVRAAHAQRTDRHTSKALDFARIALKEAEVFIYSTVKASRGKIQDKLERASEKCNLQWTALTEVNPRLEYRMRNFDRMLQEELNKVELRKFEHINQLEWKLVNVESPIRKAKIRKRLDKLPSVYAAKIETLKNAIVNHEEQVARIQAKIEANKAKIELLKVQAATIEAKYFQIANLTSKEGRLVERAIIGGKTQKNKRN